MVKGPIRSLLLISERFRCRIWPHQQRWNQNFKTRFQKRSDWVHRTFPCRRATFTLALEWKLSAKYWGYLTTIIQTANQLVVGRKDFLINKKENAKLKRIRQMVSIECLILNIRILQAKLDRYLKLSRRNGRIKRYQRNLGNLPLRRWAYGGGLLVINLWNMY